MKKLMFWKPASLVESDNFPVVLRKFRTFQRWGATLSACLLFIFQLSAQTPATSPQVQTQARAEIQRRGLDENEVRARLQQRGIDIDRVQPEQLPALQPVIEQVLSELEAEKARDKGEGTKDKGQGTGDKGQWTGDKGQWTRDKGQGTMDNGQGTKDNGQGTKDDQQPTSLSRTQAEEIQQKVKQGASVQEAISEVADTATSQLPPAQIWGQHLFRGKSLTVFRTTNEVKPPDTYVLSTGDVLTISVFGASQFDSQFEIGKDGYIKPTNLPRIFLRGVRLGQARELLRSRFAQFYRFAPEQFAVSLATARSITVNIFGETQTYGSFSLSAINTAFNALAAAGGPSDIGSVRNIKVIRGRDVKPLDVYAFMNNPAVQYDFFLEDNDIIHVPVAERVVGLKGAVRRPFRYELMGNENLTQLLDFAGGLTANAYREVVQVQRYVDDRQVLIDVNLKSLLQQKQDFVLINGDEVVVRSILSPIENTASVEGTVELPGAYSLTDTRRVSDLLKKGTLRRESRTDLAFLLRTNPDSTARLIQLNLNDILAAPGSAADLVLQPKDRLTVYATARYTDRSTVSIGGAVRNPIAAYPFPLDSTLTLQRALLLAGGLRPDAGGRGLILRENPANPKDKTYVEVDLAAAFDRPASAANVVLQPFDQLEVLSLPAFADEATFQVGGAVRKPGIFPYGRNMSLRDALLLAGGLRLEAARNRVDIFRVQISDNEPTRTVVATLTVDSTFASTGTTPGNFVILPFDEIVVRSAPEFELQRYVEVAGEVRYPGRYALVSDNETLADLLKRAGGLSPEAFTEGTSLYRTEGGKGYVVTDLSEALRSNNSPHNHILKENDRITVPKREDLVTIRTSNTHAAEVIKGALLGNGLINVALTPGKKAGWYVREYAAGFDKKAKRSRVTVEKPNGKISRTVNWGLFKIYPKVTKGSVISVGSKPVKEKKQRTTAEKKGVDWDKALPQILATLGTLATVALAAAALSK